MPLFPLVAAMLIMFFGGLLYCWSVFIAAFETELGVSRGAVSIVFSLALGAFTLGFFIATALFKRIGLAPFALLACLMASGGLMLSARVETLWALIVGYGAVFAAAAGMLYSLALQLVNTPMPVRASIATSLVTAAFAGAGLVWPKLLAWALAALGPHMTLLAIALAFAVVGSICFLLIRLSGAVAPSAASDEHGRLFHNFLTGEPRIFASLFLGFLLLAIGGLMIIGHSAGIAAAYGWGLEQSYWGPMTVSIGYVAGALLSGRLSERFGGRWVLLALAAGSAIGLLALYLAPGKAMSLVSLALVGGCFGATASAYPVTTVGYYGAAALAQVYGRLMLAYGAAGIAAPFMAGALYDAAGGYGTALLIAGTIALAALTVYAALPRAQAKHA